MNDNSIFSTSILRDIPDAMAIIKGNDMYPGLYGIANFYTTRWDIGIIIEVEVYGLPNSPSYSPRFFGMHIHEYGDCSDNFADTGTHYNPTGADHPFHLGDLVPLLNSNGYAFTAFYDSFLRIEDITGRSIVIHDNRDDFTSQPSGDSGEKIGCGVILPV